MSRRYSGISPSTIPEAHLRQMLVAIDAWIRDSDAKAEEKKPPEFVASNPGLRGRGLQESSRAPYGGSDRGVLLVGLGQEGDWGLAAMQPGAEDQLLSSNGTDLVWIDPPTSAPGTTTFTQVTVDFGSIGDAQVIETIADAAILSTHMPLANMSYDPTGVRARDELEMDQFEVKVGNIVDGVSYDLMVTCLSGWAHGEYYVNVVY